MLFPLSEQVGSPPRIVITGAGIVTSLGRGWKDNAEGFRAGRVAIRKLSVFDPLRQRVKVAAEVDLPETLPPTKLDSRDIKRMDRAARMLVIATHDAWTQAGWEGGEDLPMVLGTTSGGMNLGQAFYRQAVDSPRTRTRQPSRVLHYQAQRQALDVMDAFSFRGPVTIIGNACASGANSIGHAWELLRRGHSQRVLTGGYDAICELVFSGFDSLQALSPTTCRPFDAHRDGLALGEGAAMLTLETLELAKSRGAEILGEIVGYGASTDAHHLTQPHPQGDAALASMKAACAAARVAPEDIGYINAHGTGTPLNDSAEAAAINRWAGPRATTLPVSSTKSGVGHILGGAGAVEAVVCLMALREQFLPPTSSLETKDPVCNFPIVSRPTDSRLDYALTNSFGFGGANATLILRRWS